MTRDRQSSKMTVGAEDAHYAYPTHSVYLAYSVYFVYLRAAKNRGKLPAGKTVIRNFLGTGMISVMPVLLLSVHPRE